MNKLSFVVDLEIKDGMTDVERICSGCSKFSFSDGKYYCSDFIGSINSLRFKDLQRLGCPCALALLSPKNPSKDYTVKSGSLVLSSPIKQNEYKLVYTKAVLTTHATSLTEASRIGLLRQHKRDTGAFVRAELIVKTVLNRKNGYTSGFV